MSKTYRARKGVLRLAKERFSQLVRMVSRLDKSIKSLENAASQTLGVKSVHIFCVYSLIDAPDGLTASEIAKKNGINRSLISREIEKLNSAGVTCYSDTNHYNAHIMLTERGREVAQKIFRIGIESQKKVDSAISEEELNTFYSVLGRMTDILTGITDEMKNQ